MAEQEYMRTTVIPIKAERVIKEVQEPNGWTCKTVEITFEDPQTGEERKQIVDQYFLTKDLDKENESFYRRL